jgi:transposase InsO family protein
MALVMKVKEASLKRWMIRQADNPESTAKRGRPEVVPASVRLKIRNCYIAHYKQWGPKVLVNWAKRKGLGSYSAGTIARIIEDLRDEPLPKQKPIRYEITAPNVMWSEDGAGFREFGVKKELLLLQDECSRFKVNTRLVDGPAKSEDVLDYLREAFDKYGAPLIVKRDGQSIFHEENVEKLLDEYHVINLKSPPRYPEFNGKKERSIRDVKSYERAMKKNDREQKTTLEERIAETIHDLNEERPRPMLGGRTSREVFDADQITLIDHKIFHAEVCQLEKIYAADSCTRKQKDDARRRATQEVLLRYGLMELITDMSTYLNEKRATF